MLLTNKILERFRKQGDTSKIESKDIMVICKYFNPCGAGTWYAVEYNERDRMFYGFVSLYGDDNDELGYFSLDELENLKLPFGMKIERDLYFDECTLKSILDGDRP